jgi:UDP-glucuronate 4-epimerase
VYGANTKTPFAVGDAVDHPNSLYAATKRADELFGHTYAHLYGLPATGLRFFTVYGPWGRPDMAPILFAKAIAAGEPIRVFNHGEMWRDFTFIDDIVAGVLRALDRPATGTPPHAIYNLGNHKSEKLTDFIAEIEKALGKKAVMQMEPMQPGDVPATYADIRASTRDLGFEPTTPISVGIPKFVDWLTALARGEAEQPDENGCKRHREHDKASRGGKSPLRQTPHEQCHEHGSPITLRTDASPDLAQFQSRACVNLTG